MLKKIAIILIPVVLIFGAHYSIILVDKVLTAGRMWETPAVRPYEQPLPVMDRNVVPVSSPEAVYRQTPAEDLQSPVPGNDQTVTLGRKGYATYCAQCHGKYHDGYGTVGQSFAPPPTDLRSEKVQSLSPGAIFKEISYGIPGGRQPALDTTVEFTDRWRIVAYVKSLGVRK
jgi:mono/diheme cytochrome c family protein